MSVTRKIKSAFGIKESLHTVSQVAFDQLLGNWYEIAHIHPISGEYLVNSMITIQEFMDTSAGSDSEGMPSKLRIIHVGNKGGVNGPRMAYEGKLKVKDDEYTKMKVKFPGGFKSGFYVIDKDEYYQWLLIGDKSRKNVWILSRSPQMDKTLIDTLMKELISYHFDAHKLQLVQQTQVPKTAVVGVVTTTGTTNGTTTAVVTDKVVTEKVVTQPEQVVKVTEKVTENFAGIPAGAIETTIPQSTVIVHKETANIPELKQELINVKEVQGGIDQIPVNPGHIIESKEYHDVQIHKEEVPVKRYEVDHVHPVKEQVIVEQHVHHDVERPHIKYEHEHIHEKREEIHVEHKHYQEERPKIIHEHKDVHEIRPEIVHEHKHLHEIRPQIIHEHKHLTEVKPEIIHKHQHEYQVTPEVTEIHTHQKEVIPEVKEVHEYKKEVLPPKIHEEHYGVKQNINVQQQVVGQQVVEKQVIEKQTVAPLVTQQQVTTLKKQSSSSSSSSSSSK